MGGVETDLYGRTSVPGLFAAGEVACTGVHGANRLASNSLLEGLVFGARAADAMQAPLQGPSPHADVETVSWPASPGAREQRPEEHEVRDLMWRSVGLLREREGLAAAVDLLEGWWRGLEHARVDGAMHLDLRRIESLTTVGFLIARAALRREESRGSHFRADFPQRDDIHWKKHVSDQLATTSNV
jgi:L-aspartate oxidase